MAKKILLVEDSDTQLKFLQEGLSKNGFEIETATNGAEGYKKIFEFQPDLVLSDIMMPIIDGYQLCRMKQEHSYFCSNQLIYKNL